MAKAKLGNKNPLIVIGANGWSLEGRQREDFYATDPIAAELLLDCESFVGKIWEPACGQKHLSKVFEAHGFEVRSSDIIDRCGNEVLDFLGLENQGEWDGNIITNPPYRFASEFVYRALAIIPDGYKVAMFLKVQFMEGKARKQLFTDFPPKVIYISSSRILCAKDAQFERMKEGGGSAIAYAWYVWQKGYKGDTIVKWIN